MPTLWNKLDSGLGSRYGDFLRSGADARLLVSLFYQGELAEIEAEGFRTVYRGPAGYATGSVLLSEIERIAAHPGVVRLSSGHDAEPMLDASIPQINARPEIWEWDATQSKFVPATGKGTGKDVLIGVIDTGIDWRHPFFLKETEPVKVTRIRAIWDQGLRPSSDEVASAAPDAALLTGEAGAGVTYGVEYNFARIEAALNNGPSIRHRDCNGHGTHVASIAAGNGGPSRTFIGVAPEAELIVVKYLYPQQKPTANNDPDESEINPGVAFRDAVFYILKKAEAVNKPVVINVSLGSNLGPHDGFTSTEDWLTAQFDARPKAAYVCSAGNDAGSGQHALIQFTGAGSVDVDIKLADDRDLRTKYNFCESRDDTPKSMSLQIYYPAGADPLAIALDPKDGEGTWTSPDRDAGAGVATFEGFEAVMKHVVEEQPRSFTGAGPVQRSKFELEFVGRTDAAGKNPVYREETYTLQITATAAVTAHLWCSQRSRELYLKVAGEDPPILTAPDEFLIGTSHGAENIITVASYDAEDPVVLPTAGSSSRGPLVNYESTDPHPVQKPDVAAPGVKITAAGSREVHARSRDRKNADQTTRKGGTSMASPHVAGVVALMFENNPNLTSTEIVDILRTRGRIEVPPDKRNELGQGRVDAKLAFDEALTP